MMQNGENHQLKREKNKKGGSNQDTNFAIPKIKPTPKELWNTQFHPQPSRTLPHHRTGAQMQDTKSAINKNRKQKENSNRT
jgi:hypothetical protein